VDPGVKITGDRLPDGRIDMTAVPPTGKLSAFEEEDLVD